MQQPMLRASRDIDKVASAIQTEINENAGLGINPIVPEINQDQIDGIITGICNAESYDAGKDVLFDQVENFMEGHVDDFVRENADFQYQAGLDPKVIRTAAGKCCKWCSNLAGTYKYEDVSGRGDDVWRRHRNCHCVIEYDPGQKGGKRKTVSGDRSLIDQEKADRIKKSKAMELDLQQFGNKSGEYRAQEYRHGWKKASLKETIQKFTPDYTISEKKSKGKVLYDGTDGRYQIVYDRKGNYFRILDKQSKSHKRPYVGLDGESLLNKTENGRTVGRSGPEYEQVSHFENID